MITLALLALLSSPNAKADPVCVPDNSSVICTISANCGQDGNTAYYTLRTTFQDVDTIEVDAGIANVCQVDAAKGPAALAKLQAQAQQLKDAGICKVIINNL